MSQEIETRYDQFISELGQMLRKIDVNFAMRLMYLERKIGKEEPHVVITIEYKPGIDRVRKQYELRSKHSLEVEMLDEPNKILAMGRMFLEKIGKISSDPDIKRITGKASPTIRA